ncbi:MAG: hypothetical protein AAGG09_19695 [Pseudomonadota bacterium]
MPDDHKKPIQVKKMISPFGEVKGKKAPPWFDAIPGVYRYLAPVMVDRKLMLDPRKWKKKDLEDGSYAVAKYELALFATQLSQIEKAFTKELPPVKGKRDWGSIAKSKAPKDKSAAKTAEDSVKKCWDKIAKKIDDKVSLALDEVEADKGDNKKALAAGKEALKKFGNLDTSKMFTSPMDDLQKSMTDFASGMGKSNPDQEKITAASQKLVASASSECASTAKQVQNVVKYLKDAGKKMEKDEGANAALRAVGKTITSDSKIAGALDALEDGVDKLEDAISDAEDFFKKGAGTPGDATSKAGKLKDLSSKLVKTGKTATEQVRIVAKKFSDAEKEVKK